MTGYLPIEVPSDDVVRHYLEPEKHTPETAAFKAQMEYQRSPTHLNRQKMLYAEVRRMVYVTPDCGPAQYRRLAAVLRSRQTSAERNLMAVARKAVRDASTPKGKEKALKAVYAAAIEDAIYRAKTEGLERFYCHRLADVLLRRVTSSS